VTRQKDTVSQYRYRRMPRYKRKRWVKKVKANVAMDYALAGTRKWCITALLLSLFEPAKRKDLSVSICMV